MREKLIIYGAGGHTKTVIALLRTLDRWDLVGIIDDGVPKGTIDCGLSVLGNASILQKMFDEGVHSVVNAVGGIGNYLIRWSIFERLIQIGFSFPTIIHPSAVVEADTDIADGVQILAQSYVSSESSIGFGTLINAGVILSHDEHIGRCVNLSPGALLAGAVTVDDFAQIGMGATINLEIHIGKKARIGNGATVKADVPENGRVYAGTIWPYVKHGIPEQKDLRKLA